MVFEHPLHRDHEEISERKTSTVRSVWALLIEKERESKKEVKTCTDVLRGCCVEAPFLPPVSLMAKSSNETKRITFAQRVFLMWATNIKVCETADRTLQGQLFIYIFNSIKGWMFYVPCKRLNVVWLSHSTHPSLVSAQCFCNNFRLRVGLQSYIHAYCKIQVSKR